MLNEITYLVQHFIFEIQKPIPFLKRSINEKHIFCGFHILKQCQILKDFASPFHQVQSSNISEESSDKFASATPIQLLDYLQFFKKKKKKKTLCFAGHGFWPHKFPFHPYVQQYQWVSTYYSEKHIYYTYTVYILSDPYMQYREQGRRKEDAVTTNRGLENLLVSVSRTLSAD